MKVVVNSRCLPRVCNHRWKSPLDIFLFLKLVHFNFARVSILYPRVHQGGLKQYNSFTILAVTRNNNTNSSCPPSGLNKLSTSLSHYTKVDHHCGFGKPAITGYFFAMKPMFHSAFLRMIAIRIMGIIIQHLCFILKHFTKVMRLNHVPLVNCVFGEYSRHNTLYATPIFYKTIFKKFCLNEISEFSVTKIIF